MTPAAITTAVAEMFTVHEEVGYMEQWTTQDGKVVGDGALDMTCAPCGESYVTMTSFGVDPSFSDVPALFSSERLAHEWLLDEIRFLAREIEPDDEKWKSLHFYWRSQPVFHSGTYLSMDQGGLMRIASPLAALPQMDLGFSQCEMLLTKTGPDGKEG